MKLPPLAQPERYVGLFVYDFKTHVSVGYTAVEIRYLRPFRQHALSKTGDSEKRQLVVEYTLKNSNNAGHGIVADVTTS